MDDGREKHPICDMCCDEKLPTTYQCGVGCPANPGAWDLHGVFHKELRKRRKMLGGDDGFAKQKNREVAEEGARLAAQTGDESRGCWLRVYSTPRRRTGAEPPRSSAK